MMMTADFAAWCKVHHWREVSDEGGEGGCYVVSGQPGILQKKPPKFQWNSPCSSEKLSSKPSEAV